MDSQGEETEKKVILKNLYTRGHIHLFIEAERRFGFNEVIDWMKFGQDTFLHAEDITRIRNLRPNAGKAAVALAGARAVTRSGPVAGTTSVSPGPSKILLKGISWTRARPMCVINDQTFEPNEQGRIRLGSTNVLIRCVAIRQDGVTIRMVNSGEEKMLALGDQ
jgi:hypothetical protein